MSLSIEGYPLEGCPAVVASMSDLLGQSLELQMPSEALKVLEGRDVTTMKAISHLISTDNRGTLLGDPLSLNVRVTFVVRPHLATPQDGAPPLRLYMRIESVTSPPSENVGGDQKVKDVDHGDAKIVDFPEGTTTLYIRTSVNVRSDPEYNIVGLSNAIQLCAARDKFNIMDEDLLGGVLYKDHPRSSSKHDLYLRLVVPHNYKELDIGVILCNESGEPVTQVNRRILNRNKKVESEYITPVPFRMINRGFRNNWLRIVGFTEIMEGVFDIHFRYDVISKQMGAFGTQYSLGFTGKVLREGADPLKPMYCVKARSTPVLVRSKIPKNPTSDFILVSNAESTPICPRPKPNYFGTPSNNSNHTWNPTLAPQPESSQSSISSLPSHAGNGMGVPPQPVSNFYSSLITNPTVSASLDAASVEDGASAVAALRGGQLKERPLTDASVGDKRSAPAGSSGDGGKQAKRLSSDPDQSAVESSASSAQLGTDEETPPAVTPPTTSTPGEKKKESRGDSTAALALLGMAALAPTSDASEGSSAATAGEVKVSGEKGLEGKESEMASAERQGEDQIKPPQPRVPVPRLASMQSTASALSQGSIGTFIPVSPKAALAGEGKLVGDDFLSG